VHVVELVVLDEIEDAVRRHVPGLRRPDLAQRVGVFIDTQNLYHSAKHLYKARVNFAKVLEEAVDFFAAT